MAYLKGINLSGSTEITGSQAEFIEITGSSITGSFTGSFSATEIVDSNLTVSGTASINYLETTYESSSIIYSSGSTKFGNSFDDTHQFTGSVSISGSLTSDLIGTASYASTASYITASNVDGLPSGFPYVGSAEITGSLAVSGSITAYQYNIDPNATGTPALYSSTNLNLSASNAVVITSSPLRVASLTNTETGSFTGQDGDIIFNSTRAAYMVYSGSDWQEVIIEGSTASYASQALSSSHAITASYITASNVDGLPDGFPYTGSAIISGSLIVTGSIYSDSLIYATASHAVSASYAATASYVKTAQTSSYIAGANVDGTVTSASYAPNTGVTSIIAGSGIVIDQSTGNITISTDTIVGGSILTGSFSSTTSTSVTHNFGSKNVIIAIYDDSGNEIIPSTLTLDSANKVTATFAAPQSGTLVVIEAQSGEYASGSFSNTGSFTLNHSLGTQDLNVIAYDSNDVQFYPDIDILDSSNLKATFAASSSGTLLAIVRAGTVSSSFSNTVDTTITHNLSSSAVIASVYDASYNKIIPSSVSIVDTSSINLTFASPSSGNVVIVGGPIDATGEELATTYNQAINGSSSYTVTHNLNAEWPLVQIYDSTSRSQVREYTVTSINSNSISATFTSSFNGFIIINS